MAFSSSSRSSAKRSCKGTRWLPIVIWTSLIIASANCEYYKLKTTNDKGNINYGIKAVKETRRPRFIQFDGSSSKITLDLELSIPFLTIPFQDKNGLGGNSIPPLQINPQSILIFGALATIASYAVPLLSILTPGSMPTPSNIYSQPNLFAKEYKRTDRGLDVPSYLEDSINEILDVNSNSTWSPCFGRLVCSAVATAKGADQPNKIDALFSNKLFEEAVNGTVIKEAAAKGREVSSAEDCATTYTECAFNQKMLLNALKIFGL